jgi:hypothetical protein
MALGSHGRSLGRRLWVACACPPRCGEVHGVDVLPAGKPRVWPVALTRGATPTPCNTPTKQKLWLAAGADRNGTGGRPAQLRSRVFPGRVLSRSRRCRTARLRWRPTATSPSRSACCQRASRDPVRPTATLLLRACGQPKRQLAGAMPGRRQQSCPAACECAA